MMKSARLLLTALFVLVFAMVSFAAMGTTSNTIKTAPKATMSRMDNAPMATDELDDPVVIYNFEIDDLSEWTWGNNRQQESFWAASDYQPHGGTNSWRPYNPEYGNNGGYANTWYQRAFTPALDLTATSEPELTFWFKLVCEESGDEPTGYDAWDGANFWIRYTNGDDEVVTDVVTTFDGTAYNGTSYFSFGHEWFYGPGIPGWNGTIDWTEITMDLSGYTDYDDVQIIFAFASDPGFDTVNDPPDGDPTLSGFQLDDVVIADGETVLFSDDAEDPDNTTFIFEGGLETFVEGEYELVADLTDAPSPTHALGLDNQTHGYEHYLESPTFDLPELEEGQRLFFDLMVSSNMDGSDEGDYYPHWTIDIYDPEQDVWWNADAIRGLNTASNFVGSTSSWSSVNGFGTTEDDVILEGTPLAGMTGVKARIIFYSPIEDYSFSYCMWDNFTYEVRGVQHDIATGVLVIPRPVNVGLPIPGTWAFSNEGINDETFVGLWGLVGGTSYPGTIGSTINLTAGASVSDTIDTPNDEFTGWIPTAAMGNTSVGLVAFANIADEDLTNNRDTTEVYVGQVGEYEFGYDNHDPTNVYTMNNANTGPMTRFVMGDNNPYFTDKTMDLSAVYVEWYALPDAQGSWPTGGVPMRIHVYQGGDTPGTELVSQEVSLSISGGAVGWAQVDISGVEALQDVVGADFYVWVELYTTVNGLIQPSIVADDYNTGALYPDNNLFYDGTNVSAAGFASFIHVSGTAEGESADEPITGTLPGKYALEEAYPNPFNPTTTLRYDVARNGLVSLKVFNVMGQEVATLVNRQVRAGSYTATFDASTLSSGVYFVRMQADGFNAVRKVMLMK